MLLARPSVIDFEVCLFIAVRHSERRVRHSITGYPKLMHSGNAVNLCAVREDVERALAFITACQVDANCALEEDETEQGEKELNSSAHIGLKAGLALALLPMTVISSFIPLLFMRAPSYNVRVRL